MVKNMLQRSLPNRSSDMIRYPKTDSIPSIERVFVSLPCYSQNTSKFGYRYFLAAAFPAFLLTYSPW